jgi:ELWxxDGT repeat protein
LSLEPLESRCLLSAALVKDINTAPVPANPTNLTAVNGTLFFSAQDDIHGRALWKSDGTAAGTALVKDFHPAIPDANPEDLTNVNGTLFFVLSRYAQLWKSDGTPEGTVLVW